MDWTIFYGPASAPVVIALVGLLRWLKLPTDASPVVAVVTGVLWNLAVGSRLLHDPRDDVLWGVLAGLAAAGLYDLGKPVAAASVATVKKLAKARP